MTGGLKRRVFVECTSTPQNETNLRKKISSTLFQRPKTQSPLECLMNGRHVVCSEYLRGQIDLVGDSSVVPGTATPHVEGYASVF